MAGGGKTTLAAQLAYLLAPYFPGGVLWARLDTDDPLAVAGTFAAAYGRDVSAYPDLESRSRVLREVLAHKRALLILDNAENGAARLALLIDRGAVARQQGRLADAAALLHEALELAGPRTEPGRAAALLGQLGVLARQQGDYAQAAHLFKTPVGSIVTRIFSACCAFF